MECGVLVTLKDGKHKLFMSNNEQYNYLVSEKRFKKLTSEEREKVKLEIIREVELQGYRNIWAKINII